MDISLVVPGKNLLALKGLLETGGEFSHKYISLMWFSKNSMCPVQGILLYFLLLVLNNSKTQLSF